LAAVVAAFLALTAGAQAQAQAPVRVQGRKRAASRRPLAGRIKAGGALECLIEPFMS